MRCRRGPRRCRTSRSWSSSRAWTDSRFFQDPHVACPAQEPGRGSDSSSWGSTQGTGGRVKERFFTFLVLVLVCAVVGQGYLIYGLRAQVDELEAPRGASEAPPPTPAPSPSPTPVV